jgi:hypothetical protein
VFNFTLRPFQPKERNLIRNLTLKEIISSDMSQEVIHRQLIAKDWVRIRINLRGICGSQTGAGTGLSPRAAVSPASVLPLMFYAIHTLITQTVQSQEFRASSQIT